MAAASLRWILQAHRDVPKAAKLYSEGLGFTINVCTLRWAELQSGPLKLALFHSPSEHGIQKGYSSILSFTVTDINNTVTKLMALGAELDGPIKYEVHGKLLQPCVVLTGTWWVFTSLPEKCQKASLFLHSNQVKQLLSGKNQMIKPPVVVRRNRKSALLDYV
ncbi:unnamed protein product [Camellia sinensis]